jgi:hypothetical protein
MLRHGGDGGTRVFDARRTVLTIAFPLIDGRRFVWCHKVLPQRLSGTI